MRLGTTQGFLWDIASPRDEAYYGDPGMHYTYSRREYKPLSWIPELLSLKARVEEATPVATYANLGLPKLGYNAVLCNLPSVTQPRINLTVPKHRAQVAVCFLSRDVGSN